MGMAVDQQGQHHARFVLRRARTALIDLELVHLHQFHGLEHEMCQILLGNPLAHALGQHVGLIAFTEDEPGYEPRIPLCR